MKSSTWTIATLALAGAALLGGCAADDETIIQPEGEQYGGELFSRSLSAWRTQSSSGILPLSSV